MNRSEFILLVSVDVSQNPQQKGPEFLHRVYIDSFVRRMYSLQGGTKREHVHSRELLTDDSTFQTGMNSFDLWLYPKEGLIRFSCHSQDWGVHVRFPAWIAVGTGDTSAPQPKDGTYCLTNLINLRGHRTPLARNQGNFFLTRC